MLHQRAWYPSAFRLRRCTTLLTPSSVGQLGRKLRGWGVHKHDSKNRPSNVASRLYHDDLQAGVAETLLDTDEGYSTFSELPGLPEPTEYDDADLRYTTLDDPSPAVVATSNNSTASMSTPQHIIAYEEDVASSVSTIATVTEEPENGRPSDIDMDGFSLLWPTPSVPSGFASLYSPAQRILPRQGEESSLRRDSLNGSSSSVVGWNRLNSSLQPFERLSFSSSIASSQMANGSRMSYAMLSNGSQYGYAPKEKLQYGMYQQSRDLLQCQVSPLVDFAEFVDQHSPILTSKAPPPTHICVACNIPFRNKSSLSRHWRLHCERDSEWVCLLCVPPKSFDRKGRLYRHHIDNHGEECAEGCRQYRDLLCPLRIAWSISRLPPKKAWGCPCCFRCFDTFAAWTKHCANHPLQNDKVIGWSLGIMIQSLMLQPCLTDAITRLPLHMFDVAKANADVYQNLREALERHKLPDAVQGHYDYRYLQLPEALVQYAFRLVAYSVPYDVFYPDASLITSESAAKAIAK